MDKNDANATDPPPTVTLTTSNPNPNPNPNPNSTSNTQTNTNTHTPSVVDLAEQFNIQANFQASSGSSGAQDLGLSPDILARRRARQRRRQARQRRQRDQAVAASRAQRVFGSGIGGGVGETDEMLSGMLERLERRMDGLRSGSVDAAGGTGVEGSGAGFGRFATVAAELGLSAGGGEVWGEPGENDEQMQRILEESYQSSKPAAAGGSGGRSEEDELRRAIEASLKEQAQSVGASTSASSSGDNEAELGDNVDLDDKDLLEKLKMEDEIARKLIEEGVAAEEKLERQRRESATEKMLLDAQLESLRDSIEEPVITETRRIFLEMRDKSKRDGGRPADFELALSMAQDQAKERKKQAAREEEEVIQQRQQESRKARAKRFADAMERKLQGKKSEN